MTSNMRPASIRSSLKKSYKVLFCGSGHFQSAFDFTKESLESKCPDVNVFQCKTEDVLKEAVDADIIIPLMCKITKAVIENSPNLKMIMQFGVGLEGVDALTATEKKIWVSRIPSADTGNAASCAEHAIYLTLALFRNVHEMNQSLLTGRLGVPTGRTLLGSNALIYGYGGIGTQLARRLAAFGTVVDVVTRSPAKVVLEPHLNRVAGIEQFCELARDADIVYMCCTQNPNTLGVVNKEFLDAMKEDSFLVNVSRGGLLNYSDVLEALDSGRLGGLGTDVFHTEPFPDPSTDPILSHPRVLATPHVAGVTIISYRNMAEAVTTNVQRIIGGEDPLWAVNGPFL